MKLTKSKLKQIITEEANSYLDEMVDNLDLEYEDEGMEDDEYLLSMLSREFERIPVERRKSVYTRFLSAANKYADQVNPAASPIAAAALEEQFVNSLMELKVLNEVSVMGLAKKLAQNPKARNALVAALMSMGVEMSSGDAQAGGTATSDFAQAQQSQAYKGYQPGGTEKFQFGTSGEEGAKLESEENPVAQLMLWYQIIAHDAVKTRSPVAQALKSKMIELAATKGAYNTDLMLSALEQDKGFMDSKAMRQIAGAAWEKFAPKAMSQIGEKPKWRTLDIATSKKLAAKWDKLVQQYKGNLEKGNRFE